MKRTTGTAAEAYRPRLPHAPVEPRTAIVTGATGQDGWYLVRRLLADGWTVHAAVRDVDAAEATVRPARAADRGAAGHPRPRSAAGARRRRPARGALQPRRREQRQRLVRRPAGDLGVERARRRPPARRVRLDSPSTRVYQASSGEMFGSVPGESVVHDENAAAQPAEPVRRRQGGRAHALPELPRVVRDPDRVRDPLQPRVAPARAAVPLAQGGRPRAGAPRRARRTARSRSGT